MSHPARNLSERHQSTREKMRWLTPNPNLPTGTPQFVALLFENLAWELVSNLDDGPQLTIALQRLVDAKDAAVRQAIADSEQ